MSQYDLSSAQIEEQHTGEDVHFFLSEHTPSLRSSTDTGTGFSGYGKLFLRGMSDERLSVTLNGVPLNDMVDYTVYFNNVADLMSDMELVRVQRGLSVSHQGASAYAGAIDMRSHTLWQKIPAAETKVTLGAGSFETFRISASHKQTKPKDFASYLRVSGVQSEGFKYNSSSEGYSSFFSAGHAGKHHVVKLNAMLGRAQNNRAYDPQSLSEIKKDKRSNKDEFGGPVPSQDRDQYMQGLVSLEYTQYLSNARQTLSFVPYYGGASGFYPYSYMDENGDFVQPRYGLRNQHVGFMSYWSYAPTHAYTLKVGGHAYAFHRRNWESNFTDADDTPYYQDRTRKQEGNVWIKNRYELGKVSLFADVQVRQVLLALRPDNDFLEQTASVPDRNYTFANPWVGANWSLNPQLRVSSSLGYGNREPRRLDILGGGTINAGNLSSVQDLNSLRHERVLDWESRLRWQHRESQASLQGFYVWFRDEIMPTGKYLAEYYTQLSQNVDRSFRRGVELDADLRLTPWFSLGMQGTWMQARIEAFSPEGDDNTYENMHSPYSPEWQARLSPTFHYRFLSVGLVGEYVGDAFLEPTNRSDMTLPDYYLLGARTSLVWKGQRLTLHARNLTDEIYYVFGTAGTEEPSYLIQPPRRFSVQWSYRF